METKFFQKDGEVVQTRTVIAWSERRMYCELAARLKGLDPGQRIEHYGELTVSNPAERLRELLVRAAERAARALDEIAEAEWDQVITVNLKSVFFMTQAVVSGMRQRQWGHQSVVGSGTNWWCGGGALCSFQSRDHRTHPLLCLITGSTRHHGDCDCSRVD